jgi:DoxX-like family
MQANVKLASDPTMNKRARRIAYWLTTGLLAFGMAAGGTGQVVRATFNVDGMIHLGYPLYVLTIVGVWKLLGVIVLLSPRLPLIKEWTYAGFFFVLTGATASHIASGDGISGFAAPMIFACLTVASWLLRPADRRLAATLPGSA